MRVWECVIETAAAVKLLDFVCVYLCVYVHDAGMGRETVLPLGSFKRDSVCVLVILSL